MHMGTRFTTEPAVSLGTEILFALLHVSVKVLLKKSTYDEISYQMLHCVPKEGDGYHLEKVQWSEQLYLWYLKARLSMLG